MRRLKKHFHFVRRKGRVTHVMSRGLHTTLCNQGVMSGKGRCVPTKKHPICKRCEKEADKKKLWDRDIKVSPCPDCGNEGIALFNCGYSSFNPGGGECHDCGLSLSSYVNWNASDAVVARVWNSQAKERMKPGDEVETEGKLKAERAKSRKLRKQLRALGKEPVA